MYGQKKEKAEKQMQFSPSNVHFFAVYVNFTAERYYS